MFIGTHCYIISPEGARKMLKNKKIYHADAVISMDTNINLYCYKKPLATQEVCGLLRYNHTITYEWMLMEPCMALGKFITIRNFHFVLLCIVFMIFLLFSNNNKKNLGIIIVISIIFYYFMVRQYIETSLSY